MPRAVIAFPPMAPKKNRKKGFFSRDVPGVSQGEKPTACEKNCRVHGNGFYLSRKRALSKNKALLKRPSDQTIAQDKDHAAASKWGGGKRCFLQRAFATCLYWMS
mmetsp:Transcript_73503/g.119286  ORF Transcript_73503/g.119286 Transcript_73503/m.119286 type:complete len:105 (+) Transcript_73503:3-317(+)